MIIDDHVVDLVVFAIANPQYTETITNLKIQLE